MDTIAASKLPPLVARRKLAALSQDEVARELGVDRSRYSRIERGFAPLTESQSAVLAGLFGVDRDTIVSDFERSGGSPVLREAV